MSLHRRLFLTASAALGASVLARGRHALAIGESSKFRFGHLQLGESWNPRPSALRRVSWEIAKRTSIDVELSPRVVTLDSDTLHETPLLYLAGDREFDVPAERDVAALRRFLTFGGFLIIDSAEGSAEGAFDQSVRRLLAAVYPPPASELQQIPGDHVVFKSFYLIERPVGRLSISPTMEGILHDSRLVVAYSQNDLGGAFARDNFGNYEYQCVPGGHQQRQLAFRMMVNLVMYALCLDYKADQVHVPFIMRRRRWRPNDGASETPHSNSPAPIDTPRVPPTPGSPSRSSSRSREPASPPVPESASPAARKPARASASSAARKPSGAPAKPSRRAARKPSEAPAKPSRRAARKSRRRSRLR